MVIQNGQTPATPGSASQIARECGCAFPHERGNAKLADAINGADTHSEPSVSVDCDATLKNIATEVRRAFPAWSVHASRDCIANKTGKVTNGWRAWCIDDAFESVDGRGQTPAEAIVNAIGGIHKTLRKREVKARIEREAAEIEAAEQAIDPRDAAPLCKFGQGDYTTEIRP